MVPDILLDPYGPFQPAWFANDTLSPRERLQIYITQAEARPELEYADDRDVAITRWVEYRVYTWLRMQNLEQGGVKSITLKDQGSVELDTANSPGVAWGKKAADALRGWRLLTASPIPIRAAGTGEITGYSWPPPEEESS